MIFGYNHIVSMRIYGPALLAVAIAAAHPGGSIHVDAEGRVVFVDTGKGVWRAEGGKLTLLSSTAYHWMAFDQKGHFAGAKLGDFDGGTFEHVKPAFIISSDYPVTIGRDGALYYVPYNKNGPRQLVRRSPAGARSVFANLPTETGEKAMSWVNGLVTAPGGALYATDNDAILRIGADGAVTTVHAGIQSPRCNQPLDGPKLPYLRGLDVAPGGTIYAAANGCRTAIAISPNGAVRILLESEPPWSPTAVALHGSDLYVLEYLHTPTENRAEWIPRVRKITAAGAISTVATVTR